MIWECRYRYIHFKFQDLYPNIYIVSYHLQRIKYFDNFVYLYQVPTSVDRALVMASVTGGPGLPVALTEDYESKQALSIAQSTVTSLRDRLAQKEETLEK